MEKSKYKGVYPTIWQGDVEQLYYRAKLMYRGVNKNKVFKTEREAAIAYDMMCIDFGLPPVNILKPI
jgi:hypothetical protein